MEKKILTLSFALNDTHILLGLKKRGFGEGKWNGFGGKVEDGETISEAAVREFREEVGLEVLETDLDKRALLDFYFKNGDELRVHTFFTKKWSGEIAESDEMMPKWFSFADIPYEKMWSDDIHWLPRVLKGEKLFGSVWFKSDNETIERMEWEEVEMVD